jgi:hypothetical protein
VNWRIDIKQQQVMMISIAWGKTHQVEAAQRVGAVYAAFVAR